MLLAVAPKLCKLRDTVFLHSVTRYHGIVFDPQLWLTGGMMKDRTGDEMLSWDGEQCTQE